MTEYSKCR